MPYNPSDDNKNTKKVFLRKKKPVVYLHVWFHFIFVAFVNHSKN